MGLLDNGMDMASLQQLAAQFGPNDEDRKRAMLMSALTAGIGLLGVRRNHRGEDLSRLGLGTLGTYDTSLNESTKLRSANLAQAMQYMNLQKEMQTQDAVNNLFGGKPPAPVTQGVAPEAGVSPRTASQFGAPSDTAGFQPMPPSPMQVPPGTDPTQVNGYRPPSWKAVMPSEVKGLAEVAARKGDIKTALEYVSKYSQTERGPDGTVMNAVGLPLYKQTDAGIQFYNDNGAPGQFYAFPQASTDAAANRTATIEGAKTAAVEKAKTPYTIGTMNLPGGGTQQLPMDEMLRVLRGGQGGVPAPLPDGSSGQAPSPVALKGREAATTDFITNSYRPVMSAGDTAKASNASLDLLDRLPINEQTGWGRNMAASAANVLTGLGFAPDDVKKFATDAQLFNRAVFEKNWQILGQQKGMQTEGDSLRALKTWQQLENTPQANQFSRDFSRATNNLAIKQRDYYAKNYAGAIKSGDASSLETQWSQQAPSIWDDPAMQKWKKYGEPQAAAGGGVLVQAPNGKSYTFPDDKAAAAFRQRFNLQ